MPTRNINLTDHFNEFIEEEISAGRYRNASEVMRAGLRMLEQSTRQEREKLVLLRSLATEAFQQLDQGQGIELGSERQLAKFIAGIGHSAAMDVQHRKRATD